MSVFCIDALKGLLAKPRYAYVMAFIMGVVGSFGHEKYAYVALSILSLVSFFVGLFFLAKTSSPISIVKITFLYFWGYLTGGLHWFAYSIHADYERFWWLIPFAVFGLPALLTLFYIPIAFFARRIALASSLMFFLTFALFISLGDYMRSHLFTGLPWHLWGQIGGDAFLVHSRSLYAMGGVNFVGLYFLIICALCAQIIWNICYKKRFSKTLGVVLFIIGILPSGMNKVESYLYPVVDNTEYSIPIILIQPNIPQIKKWDPFYLPQNIQTLITLSKNATRPDNPVIYVWPEAALPSVYHLERASFFAKITTFMRKGDLLITGIPRYTQDVDGIQTFYNSLIVLNSRGEILYNYDKEHLVPFGEYVPLRSLFGHLIESFVPGRYDYSSGKDNNHDQVLPDILKGMVPLICYEGIFGDEVRSRVIQKTQQSFLLNITNDGWFLDSSGPYQHHHISKMRAIELGMPLVRVAWKGISSVTNFYGQEKVRINSNQADFVYHNLLINYRNTIYKSYGDKIYYCLIIILIIFMLLFNIRRRFFNL